MITLKKLLEHIRNPEIIQKLIPRLSDVRYAIIGGLAVSLYTNGKRKVSYNDIDILIDRRDANKVESLMETLGFSLLKKHFFDGKQWYQYEYSGQTLDIALASDSFSMDGISRASTLSLHNHPLRVINRDSLLVNKLLAGREKDYRDILYLLKEMNDDEISFAFRKIIKNAPSREEDFEQLIQDSKTFDYRMIDEIYPGADS